MLLVPFMSLCAYGQETGEASVEEMLDHPEVFAISVIGTIIRETPIDTPVAISATSREEFEEQGSPQLVDLFKNLGASHGVVGERNSFYNSSSQPATIAESVASVNLRGLGASRTLTLINGRRQTYVPARLIGGRFTDVNTIPTIAIERLEVLKEGAAALYGSDAVGGIVNFVTRENFKGFEASLAQEVFDKGENTTLSAIWGADLGAASGVIAVEHERRSDLLAQDRDWALRDIDPNAADWRAAWSSVGNPGYFWFPAEALDAAAMSKEEFFQGIGNRRGKADPRCEDLGGRETSYSCLFRYQHYDNFIEEMRNTRAFAELNGPWGDSADFHLEALYSEAVIPEWRTTPSYPPFAWLNRGVFEIGSEHPGRVAFCDQYGQPGGEFAGECVSGDNWYFRGRPFGNSGPANYLHRASSTWRLAASLEGEFSAFKGREMHYDASLSYSRSEGNVNEPSFSVERLFLAYRGYGGADCGVRAVPDDTLAPGMRLGDTGGARPGTGSCSYYNPFSNAIAVSDQAPLGLNPAAYSLAGMANPDHEPRLANSEELRAWLRQEIDLHSETELLVADFTLSGSWIEDVASYAAGYQFRRFDVAGNPNAAGNNLNNPCPVLGDTGCNREYIGPYGFRSLHNPYVADQSVHRLFSEVAVNLGASLDVQAALNYEKYDQASSLDPRLALSWRPADGLTLRASAQTTFRAPSVDDLNEKTPLESSAYVSQTGAWLPLEIYGDENLEPESAFTYNIGAVMFLHEDVEFSIDYWHYDFDDVIGALPLDNVDDAYANPATKELVRQYVRCVDGLGTGTCAASEMVALSIPLVNWPGIETSGLDWNLSGRFDLGAGELLAGLSGTYTRHYQIKALSLGDSLLQPAQEAAGYLNFGHPLAVPIPAWKGQASATYYWGSYSLAGYLNYISSYRDQGYAGGPSLAPKIDAFATLDLTFRWQLPNLGLNLSLSALNLTDEDPPFADVELAYDGFTHNPKGRRLRLGLSYGFE